MPPFQIGALLVADSVRCLRWRPPNHRETIFSFGPTLPSARHWASPVNQRDFFFHCHRTHDSWGTAMPKTVSEQPLVRMLHDAQLMMQLANLTMAERRRLCNELAGMMERETVSHNSREQQDWLVAKAWSSAIGKTKTNARHSGPRRKVNWPDIRAMFEGPSATSQNRSKS